LAMAVSRRFCRLDAMTLDAAVTGTRAAPAPAPDPAPPPPSPRRRPPGLPFPTMLLEGVAVQRDRGRAAPAPPACCLRGHAPTEAAAARRSLLTAAEHDRTRATFRIGGAAAAPGKVVPR